MASQTSLKKAIMIGVSIIFGLLLILKFTPSKSTDIQTILQNLPKEISQSINPGQKAENELLLSFKKLSEDLIKKQEDQFRNFDRERKVLEKKIEQLQQPLQHATLREKLAHVYRYGSTKRFPAYIWQSWPYSPMDNRLDENLRNFQQNWINKNPGFVHEVANDDMVRAIVHHMYVSIPEVVEAFDSLPSNILKIDFFKYLILLAKGGVYADIDTNPLQPVPNWIPENVMPTEVGVIMGIEVESDQPDWRSKYVRRLQFENWVIQCKPGHPILREMVARVTETTLQRKADGELNNNLRNDLNIMSWTGSGLWTDVVFTYLNDYVQSGVFQTITWKDFKGLTKPKLVGDVLVFPSQSFNVDDDVDDNLQLVKHIGMKSWKANTPNAAKDASP